MIIASLSRYQVLLGNVCWSSSAWNPKPSLGGEKNSKPNLTGLKKG